MRTFADFVEKKRAERVDEGFFGMFASPLAKMIDAHPAYQSLAQRYDKAKLAKIRKALEDNLTKTGNDPNTPSGRAALQGLIGQTIQQWAGQGGGAPSATANAKVTAPMNLQQQQDIEGQWGR